MKLALNQDNYWDSVAHDKKFNHQIEWPLIEEYLHSKSDILDFGCGYGRLTNEIYSRGYKNVIGADSSIEMIKRANEEHKDVSFHYVSSNNTDFRGNRFDAVFLFAVLTCIPLSIDQKKIIGEISRILKPGGCLYVSDLLINSDRRNENRYQNNAYEEYGIFKHQEGVIFRHHDLDYLKKDLFVRFNILEEKQVEVLTMNGNRSRSIQLVLQLKGKH